MGTLVQKDKELDMSPFEVDNDGLMIEEDDISDDDDDHEEVVSIITSFYMVVGEDLLPVCTPEKVHDVKLGDTADDPTVPSGRDACAAAAATAGLASVSGGGIRGGRDRRGVSDSSRGNDRYKKLIFTEDGKHISKRHTRYQAVQCQLLLDGDEDERFNSSELPNDGSKVWIDIFTVTYQEADGHLDGLPRGGSSSSERRSKSSNSVSASKFVPEIRQQHASLLDSILQGELLCDVDKSNPTCGILAVLRVLDGLNQLAPRLKVQEVADDFAEGKIFKS